MKIAMEYPYKHSRNESVMGTLMYFPSSQSSTGSPKRKISTSVHADAKRLKSYDHSLISSSKSMYEATLLHEARQKISVDESQKGP